MSYIARRGISTLIPPKIASPSGLGAAKDAVRMNRVAKFYKRLPRGPAPDPVPSGPLGGYKLKHFGKNPSGKPLLHIVGGMLLLGYSLEYYNHLRHHKNNAH